MSDTKKTGFLATRLVNVLKCTSSVWDVRIRKKTCFYSFFFRNACLFQASSAVLHAYPSSWPKRFFPVSTSVAPVWHADEILSQTLCTWKTLQY